MEFMEIHRVPLASHTFDPARPVKNLRMVRLEFAPGVVTPYHLHAMPVLGYVAKGAFIVQREGGEARRYETGESVLEPAGGRMARFDNASATEPAVLIAAYLANEGEDELITFLDR